MGTKMARIPIPFLGLLFLAICLWSSMAEAQGYVGQGYKDPRRPVGARVKNLLARMTLEEKIGQMVQIERANATAQVMKDYLIGMRI